MPTTCPIGRLAEKRRRSCTSRLVKYYILQRPYPGGPHTAATNLASPPASQPRAGKKKGWRGSFVGPGNRGRRSSRSRFVEGSSPLPPSIKEPPFPLPVLCRVPAILLPSLLPSRLFAAARVGRRLLFVPRSPEPASQPARGRDEVVGVPVGGRVRPPPGGFQHPPRRRSRQVTFNYLIDSSPSSSSSSSLLLHAALCNHLCFVLVHIALSRSP